MLVTFYLSGPYSATTLSTEFTIVGNPGAETHTGITKQQLLTGHSITFSESVTGGTVTATNETCNGTVVNWFVTPQATPTPTPTSTPVPAGNCFTYTYSSVPSDLYVRYRRFSDDTVVTELINSLETLDNGDGTYTAAICVSTIPGYNVPVCVQYSVEVTCPSPWEDTGCTCTTNGMCFLGCS